LAFAAATAAAALIEYYLVEKLWLKPALDYMRPPDSLHLPPPAVSKWFSNLLGEDLAASNGAPSGFVLRQLLASLSGLLALFSLPRGGKRSGKLITGVLSGLLVIALGWTAFSRVYSGHHYLFDIMLAIGIGTIIFWIVVLATTAVWYRARRNLRQTSRECWRLLAHRSKMMLPFTLVVVLVVFLISGESRIWGYMLPVLMFVISMTLGISVRMVSEGGD